MDRFSGALRRNTWVFITAFAALVSAALVGFLATDVKSDLAAMLWAGIVWALMLVGILILVIALLDTFMGSER